MPISFIVIFQGAERCYEELPIVLERLAALEALLAKRPENEGQPS